MSSDPLSIGALAVLAGEGSNLQPPGPKPGVLPLNYRPWGSPLTVPFRTYCDEADTLHPAMGSLVKKRRKRMRKKKHKKMLKRTRWQRRAAGK